MNIQKITEKLLDWLSFVLAAATFYCFFYLLYLLFFKEETTAKDFLQVIGIGFLMISQDSDNVCKYLRDIKKAIISISYNK